MRKADVHCIMRVRPIFPHGITRLPLDRFRRNLVFHYFLKKSMGKLQVSLQSGKTLHEDRYTNFVTSPPALLELENFPDKINRENQNTNFTFNKGGFFFNRGFCGIMWENIVQPDRPQMKIWRMNN